MKKLKWDQEVFLLNFNTFLLGYTFANHRWFFFAIAFIFATITSNSILRRLNNANAG